MSKTSDSQLQATEQEESAQESQQAGQQRVNVADQLSKPNLVTEDSKNEQAVKVEQDNYHLKQEQPENQLQQAETNSFQLAEKETGYFGQQNFAGSKLDVVQPSVVQQHVKQISGQQAPSGAQDTRKGPSIPFNMLIPILQAHLDRDKDMQLQTVWAKLRRNEVHKDDFLRVIRNIVGDQMLKQAAHKVFVQMQAQAQRNNQANPSQHSVFSQVSAHQIPSSGSAQLHDQKVHPPGPPNQSQKSQVSSSPQAFASSSGTQAQNSVHYLAHDNPNQNPDAKGTNARPNQPPAMNSAISLQTRNKQQQPTQFQQASQQIYGTSNPGAQAYPRSITGSTPLRSPSPISETQPSMHAHGMAPAKLGPPPTHPMMQHNAVPWQMQQNNELKTNALPPSVNTKQNSGSAGKARLVGTGNSSAKLLGKQASGGAKTNKKSGGQKKSLEAAGSTQPPSSKKQKTSGAFQEQSIDQLNDVTAVSGVNLREEEEQLLSAPKEESLASQAARRIAQEEEEKLFLRKGPLLKKLTELTLKYDLKNISGDVEHCLSMCVEERLRRFVSTLIRVSKQRIDTEKTGHRLVITSDVGRQILLMNQEAKEEWDKKQAEEADKNKKQTEVDGSGVTELEKEKEENRAKNVKPNKEEDDKMRTTAANVAARQAVGGSDMLSKWQLMAEQARQKREGLDVAAASQAGRGPASRPSPMHGKGPGDHQEASKRSHSTAFGTGGMKRPGRGVVGPQRTISVKDVISVLEREPQMTKSRLIYRLYERLPGYSTAD
ncbi:transcription initiation factor TFIID subunit 4b-like isoform X2 [Phragmites australis]|uniref:transcription initiation factor TFIID subunit 4b-like isoform X2 n=1 Tax=Phragmites australis TaxID=29695 RepID=UPI002D778AD5|nr:transcription initiation factor TFIID subunit 4b-like isoform X2 [Phragmites australis]